MWNDKNSIALSKICIYLFTVAALVLTITGPFAVGWFVKFSRAANLPGQAQKYYFMASLYAALPFAFTVLYNLHSLLINIEKSAVFTAQNALYLRRVSWCCITVAAICAVSTFYYMPYFLVAVAAAFMALIVRIVKNVFEQAILLKDEVDYTI